MTFHEFREYLADFAWFWPGVGVSIVVGLVLSPRLARVLEIRRALATALILALGLIVAATLTPSREAIRFGTVGHGTCDLGRIGPASPAVLLALGDPTLNVLLFIPLGVAIGLLPPSRRKVGLAIAAAILPFAIEIIQLLATGLDRACQSADAFDNLTGLIVGLIVGVIAQRLVGAAIGPDTGTGP